MLLTVDDCELVPQEEAGKVALTLGERLSLDVEQALGLKETDNVGEGELQLVGDADNESPTSETRLLGLTVGDSDPVTEGVREAVAHREGVGEALGEGDSVDDTVGHPELENEGEPLALWLAWLAV